MGGKRPQPSRPLRVESKPQKRGEDAARYRHLEDLCNLVFLRSEYVMRISMEMHNCLRNSASICREATRYRVFVRTPLLLHSIVSSYSLHFALRYSQSMVKGTDFCTPGGESMHMRVCSICPCHRPSRITPVLTLSQHFHP